MLSSLIADFTGSLPYTISRRTIDEDLQSGTEELPWGWLRLVKKLFILQTLCI